METGVCHFCPLCSETFCDALTLSRHKLQNHFHQTQPVRTVKKSNRLPDNTYLYKNCAKVITKEMAEQLSQKRSKDIQFTNKRPYLERAEEAEFVMQKRLKIEEPVEIPVQKKPLQTYLRKDSAKSSNLATSGSSFGMIITSKAGSRSTSKLESTLKQRVEKFFEARKNRKLEKWKSKADERVLRSSTKRQDDDVSDSSEESRQIPIGKSCDVSPGFDESHLDSIQFSSHFLAGNLNFDSDDDNIAVPGDGLEAKYSARGEPKTSFASANDLGSIKIEEFYSDDDDDVTNETSPSYDTSPSKVSEAPGDNLEAQCFARGEPKASFASADSLGTIKIEEFYGDDDVTNETSPSYDASPSKIGYKDGTNTFRPLIKLKQASDLLQNLDKSGSSPGLPDFIVPLWSKAKPVETDRKPVPLTSIKGYMQFARLKPCSKPVQTVLRLVKKEDCDVVVPLLAKDEDYDDIAADEESDPEDKPLREPKPKGPSQFRRIVIASPPTSQSQKVPCVKISDSRTPVPSSLASSEGFKNAKLISQLKKANGKCNDAETTPTPVEPKRLSTATPIDSSCEFCSTTFASDHELYSHANQQHRKMVLKSWTKCDMCVDYFPNVTMLNRHKVRNHYHQTKSLKKKGNSYYNSNRWNNVPK